MQDRTLCQWQEYHVSAGDIRCEIFHIFSSYIWQFAQHFHHSIKRCNLNDMNILNYLYASLFALFCPKFGTEKSIFKPGRMVDAMSSLDSADFSPNCLYLESNRSRVFELLQVDQGKRLNRPEIGSHKVNTEATTAIA